MRQKLFPLFILLMLAFAGQAQTEIHWADNYQLKVEDFKATPPNSGFEQTAVGSFLVSYEIGGGSLITKRNLNKYVSCIFQPKASYIDKGSAEGTTRLLSYQQLIFDLYELQARKLRQKFFEQRTRLLTKGPSVMRQEASAEHAELFAKIESDTFNGHNSDEIKKWSERINTELKSLHEFCKDCKPTKKRRK